MHPRRSGKCRGAMGLGSMQDPRKGRGDQNLNRGGAGWERGKKGGNGARVRGAIRKWGGKRGRGGCTPVCLRLAWSPVQNGVNRNFQASPHPPLSKAGIRCSVINRGEFRTRPQTPRGLEISCLFPSPCQDGSGGWDGAGWGRLLGASMEFSLAELRVTLTGDLPRPEQQAASGGSEAGPGASGRLPGTPAPRPPPP